MPDQRKFKRFEFREAIEYNREFGFEGEPVANGDSTEGFISCDISAGGLKFYSNEFIPLKKEMRVKFLIGHERQVALTGKVVWVQQVPHAETFQVGLEFDDEAAQSFTKQELSKYLEDKQEEQ